MLLKNTLLIPEGKFSLIKIGPQGKDFIIGLSKIYILWIIRSCDWLCVCKLLHVFANTCYCFCYSLVARSRPLSFNAVLTSFIVLLLNTWLWLAVRVMTGCVMRYLREFFGFYSIMLDFYEYSCLSMRSFLFDLSNLYCV